MRLITKNGQHYVDQIGLDKPLIFPGSMDKQQVARAVMARFGDQVRAETEKQKYMGDMGGNLPPEKAAMIGAGKTGEMFADFLNRPRINVSPQGQAEIAQMDQRAADRAMIEPQLQQYGGDPAMGGEAVPYFALPAGAASRPIAGLLARLGVERLPGMAGVPGMLERSVVADTAGQGAALGAASDESSAAEGAAYGVGGGVLGKALSRALRPFDQGVDPHTMRILERGQKLGYKVTPGQLTGSPAQKSIEDAMANNVFMGGTFAKISEHNQTNSNRIVADALGFPGPRTKVTGDMLDQVADRFNQQFKDLTTGQKVQLDTPGLLDALQRLESENVDYVIHNKDFRDVIDRTLNLMVKNGGWLDGKDYQILSSKLVRGIRANYKPGGNPEFGQQLQELKDAIDTAAEASIGADKLERFRSIRSDYRTYANLMKNSVINEDTGDVSLRQLGNVLRREDRYGYRRNQNKSPLYDATRFTRATVGDGVNSLTSRRQSLPAGIGTGALVAGGAMMSGSEPLPAVGAGMAIPASLWAMGRFYNSPVGRQYFGKGLLPPISDSFRRYLGQKMGAAATAGGAQGQLPAIPLLAPR